MKFKLEVCVQIRPTHEAYGKGLEIREQTELGIHDFAEMCQILARFHDLVNLLEKTK